jgi:hypothetical protein
MADYKALEAEALKKYVVEKVFVRKERFTVMAHGEQEAGEKVASGFGRHAGQTDEELMGMAVQEIGIDKKIDEEKDEKDEPMVVVPKIVTAKR